MKYTLIITAALAALTLSANAAVVAFNMESSTATGVLDTSSRQWSQIGRSGVSSDSVTLDTMTGVTATTTGSFGFYATPALDLFRTYVHNASSAINVQISGLDDAQTYNMTVFMGQDGFGRRGGLATVTTLNATNPAAEGTNPDQFTSYVEGNNYVRFDGLSTDGLGNITFAVATNVDAFGYFNGFEIQNVIPEPSAYGAIAGFLALGWVMLRRRA